MVLQLTDTQIIDASQERTEERLNANADEYWGVDKKEARCYSYIRETIENTNPDLILLTGDVVYGEFDDTGAALEDFIDFMDGFQIPWAPVFGNHDNESTKGADWQSEQFEKAEYCLFKQRELTGNGNYTVGIVQGDELKRVFFMLDSNGCGAASQESLANGHTSKTAGFGADQIAWYTDTVEKIRESSPTTKYTFAFHIQLAVFADAYEKYGFDNSTTEANPINIYRHADKEETDFGYLGRNMKNPWDADYTVWNGLKTLGVDSILVGHEHCNNASVMYEGVRLQYGQKISTYDRANFLESNGKIVGMYSGDMDGSRIPLMGGSVMELSKDTGDIQNAYVYLCESGGGNIDWDEIYASDEEIVVSGLQYGTELTSSVVAVTPAKIAGQNAWKCETTETSKTYKVYVNTELIKNKSKLTFSVYVPETSTAVLSSSLGEFCIRVKPNDLEAEAGGHINYNTNSTDENFKLTFGEWKTFSVDISQYGEACTEFAFYIATGNTIYLKDIVIE